MAAISFPPTPSINDIYTSGTRTWKWTGSVWATVPTQYQPILSDTAPTTPYTGMIWVDTTTMVEYTYYSSQWIQLPTGAGSSLMLYMPVGTVLQTVYSEYTANATLAATIPWDDTIPQVSEGTQIQTVNITPSSASNLLYIRFSAFGSWTADQATVAFFANGAANAIASSSYYYYNSAAATVGPFVLEKVYAPSTTSAVTISCRIGCNSSTDLRLNGLNSARKLGGSAVATLTVQEIKG